MASSLRQAARSLRGKLQSGGAAAQHQQRRLAGDLPVKPNRFVEEGGYRREHIEHEFRWDAKTLRNIFLFAGVAPFVVYKLTVAEFNKVDDKAARPQRDMWGSDHSKA